MLCEGSSWEDIRLGDTKRQHGLQCLTEIEFGPNSDTLACDPG